MSEEIRVSENNDIFTMLSRICTFQAPEAQTYAALYDMYRRYLLDRVLHIFKWTGLDKLGIPKYEPELITMTNGVCGWTDLLRPVGENYTPGVFFGHYGTGPTIYYDRWDGFTVNCPLASATLKVDSEVVVMRNTPTMASINPLLHKYASMLAHCDLTFNVSMINHRAANGEVVVETKEQKKAYEKYRDDLFQGRVGAIQCFGATDVGGIQYLGNDMGAALNPKELIESHKNIMDDFYHDIGVRTTWNKKGNMISEEVNGNDKMLLFNISDMLEFRQEAVDNVKKMWGGKYDCSELGVDISDELKIDEEREDGEVWYERPERTLDKSESY